MLPGFDGEVLLVACACALSCAIPGSFLFLARRTMQIEAVSHAVLLGVVGAYLVRGGDSIFLLFGGALLSAVLAIQGSAVLERHLRFYRHAATAIVFPALFALAVVLLNMRLRNSHVDTHAVLLGELALVSLDRLQVGDFDLGPRALWKSLASLALTALLLGASARNLTRLFFDPVLAHVAGVRVRFLGFVFIACTCFASVSAIDVVGSVLTLGLFALPAAAARLVTTRVGTLVAVALLFSIVGTGAGYALGLWLDVSLAGAIILGLSLPLTCALVVSSRHALVRKRVSA
jgi:manganese/zinc/iron transport system permease protein